MNLQENMAEFIRNIMKEKNKSFSEFAEELDISRNALYGYSTGEGNPTLSTLGQLSEKLDVSPAVILGVAGLNREAVLKRVLEAVQDVKELSEADRLRFAELFLEIVELWDKKDKENA